MLLVVWLFDTGYGLYEFVLGLMIGPQLVVHVRHLRNYCLFHAMIDGDGVRVYDVARPEGWIAVRAQPLHYFGGFSGELEDFAAAVLDGRELAAPPEMARDEVRIAHAMRLAAETLTWQAL